MPYSLQARILCSLLAFVAGFGVVRLGRGLLKSSTPPPEASAAAAAVKGEPSRRAHRLAPPAAKYPEIDASDADRASCDAERQEMLEYGVRAARAEFLTRYGRPPATSLLPPSDDEIDAVFPDALVSLVSCTPPPCRLAVATRTEILDFKSLPMEWGYPNGVVRGGTGRDKVWVYEFAFVAEELSPHEWKFVRNAWSIGRVHLDEMLRSLGDEGSE